MRYEKSCPLCGKIMTYNQKYNLTRSIKNNNKFKKCCVKKHTMYTISKIKQKKKKQTKTYKTKEKNNYAKIYFSS